jgi:hypothetical protein
MLQQLQQLYRPHGVAFRPVEFKDMGGWAPNTHSKPLLVHHMIALGKTALLVDADTAILPPPPFLPEGEWDVGLLDQFVQGHKNPWAASVFAVQPTQASLLWVSEWLALCLQNRAQCDHGHMTSSIIRAKDRGLKVIDLASTLKGRVLFNHLTPDRKQASF